MKRMSWAISITVSGLFASCSKNNGSTAKLYVPTNADVTTNATLEELQQGRTLYINNCAVYHSLHSPDDYSATQWKSIISGMAPRTDMSASQVDLVTKYVRRGK